VLETAKISAETLAINIQIFIMTGWKLWVIKNLYMM